ncbi:MAG: hypothetical protein EOO85_18220 [Pedobacter sp.]|nr:MAG: hypothetical protein EOO85_18220 [Pedobacter sp.]
MKYHLLFTSLLFSSLAFGQTPETTTTKTTTVVMKGSELNKMFANMKVDDKNYYDMDGNIVSSADVKAKLRTFEYELSIRKLDKFPDYKHVVHKVDKRQQALMDSVSLLRFQPNSDKLKIGMTLDVKPLYNYVDIKRLNGKIIALIFWSDAYYGKTGMDINERLNNVLSDFKIPGKIEILSITHHPAGRAAEALLKNPIVNTQHILDAQDVIKEYKTENELTVVLTDANHKILYSAKGSAAVTPRQFNKHLKAMLN